MHTSLSHFAQKVIQVVSEIPSGKVVSYGQVAAYIGAPRAARQVGWTLKHLEEDVSLPWWRVINNKGVISIDGNLYNDKRLQKQLLEQEGILVTDDYILDIEQYRFKANEKLLSKWLLKDDYKEKVLLKFGL